jgi:transmembrane sensor
MTNIMTQDRFIQLLEGFQHRRLSEDELISFFRAAEDPRFESLIGEKIHMELVQMKAASITDGQRADKVWHDIYTSISSEPHAVHRIPFLRKAWLGYAAAVIILFAIGIYLWTPGKGQHQELVVNTDIAPGRQGAILTLADGTQVKLDSMGNGMVAEQKGTKVLLKDGSLAYNASSANEVTYNTMTTPKGRQFSIQLPDGSTAWLNAASSITYPTAFIGKDRSVTISGEVYFEVARNPIKPFKVKVNDKTEIEVLGTSFNVKAYSGDATINTTLLDGAVRLSTPNRAQPLKPGEQTQLKQDGEIQLIRNADIKKIMAWKNGLFNFQDESLEEVMKQLERWYDISVRYIGDPPEKKFFGEVGRDLTLSQVIETLRETGIQCNIEGRTLIVRH